MQRMTGIDPMFIYSDTPHTPMEVAYACVFDPSTAEEGYSFERVRDVLSERLPDLLPFRRRLMTVPLGLDHPRWVDDPDFDLGNHLFRVALPEPGGPAQFTEMVAKVMSRSLVADQPPWEMHVIEGLADGRVGLIAKVHHSVVDGVAGAALMAQLLDLNPGPAAIAGTPGGGRPAQCVHPPHPHLAGRTRNRPHGGAHGPVRHERHQRAGDHSGRGPPPVRDPTRAAARYHLRRDGHA
jgi:WS/DGAT/MGAT family acyltransferase